jgi:hypothetical protein
MAMAWVLFAPQKGALTELVLQHFSGSCVKLASWDQSSYALTVSQASGHSCKKLHGNASYLVGEVLF